MHTLSWTNSFTEMIKPFRILILSIVLIQCYAKNDDASMAPKSDNQDLSYFFDAMMQDPRFFQALIKSYHNYHETTAENEEPQDSYYSPRMVYQRPAKRNSELLNSLLGLPKNILKSG